MVNREIAVDGVAVEGGTDAPTEYPRERDTSTEDHAGGIGFPRGAMDHRTSEQCPVKIKYSRSYQVQRV